MKLIREFSFPFPKIPAGKHKNKLATLNMIPVFYRFQKTKIKNQLKEYLKGWLVPHYSGEPHKSGRIEFTLKRPSKVRLDADSPCLIYKWTVDFLVEQGYFIDDDKLVLVLNPVIHDKDLVETTIEVKVYAKEME